MKFSVVIPVFNEEDGIIIFLDEVLSCLKAYDFEVIVVDDGSNDGTMAKLKSYKVDCNILRIISHEKNIGQSSAINTGVRFSKYDTIVTLDGDGQNDPADIPKLLQKFSDFKKNQENKNVIVAGYRKKRRDSLLKIFSSRVANFIRSNFLNDETPDTGCGLKVFSRDLFLKLPFFDHIHRYLPALFSAYGASILTIEVNHRPRSLGKSKYGFHNRLWVGIIDLFGVKWLINRAKYTKTGEIK